MCKTCGTAATQLAHESLYSNALCSVWSPGDTDEWDRLEVRSSNAGVQNVLYLNDEEEEEEDGEQVEQGQEGRKVTVRNTHKHDTAVLTIATRGVTRHLTDETRCEMRF